MYTSVVTSSPKCDANTLFLSVDRDCAISAPNYAPLADFLVTPSPKINSGCNIAGIQNEKCSYFKIKIQISPITIKILGLPILYFQVLNPTKSVKQLQFRL